VSGVEVRGNEISGVIEGRPARLLEVLGRHDVEHVLLPEPDLEDAFLRLYDDDDADAGTGGMHVDGEVRS
jgi:hypothetical protein